MEFVFTLDLLSLGLGFLGGLLILFAVLWPKLARARDIETQMTRVFDDMAQDSLKKSQDQFLMLAQEKLRQAQMEGSFDLERRQKSIADLVDPIGQSLKDMEQKIETLGRAGAGLEAQLKNFSEDQRYLREQTQSLVHVLRNPTARGRWGEMQLQRTFELIGFIEGVHYTTQKSVIADGVPQKPDFIVTLPNGIQIVIDVKTPLDPYWQMMDEEGTAEQNNSLVHFSQKVRDHLKSLSLKDYWRQFDSPEFVVMFLPSESLYSLAVSQDQSLLEDASRSNIILASPTTIMGLLRVVMYGWQQQKIAEEAQTVATLGSELYRRVSVFGEHMTKLGRSLNSSVENYNKAVGSLDGSVLPTLRKFKDLQVPTGGKELPDAEAIENTTRVLSSPELGAEIAPDNITSIADHKVRSE
ncbi:MAG: DNA recombination protein RmuC [Alphaproteobacteria bacterium]|jgi:DNA recombination protein RmuC|nr:DNA recombination protein RmuC [Alphaproteobacteria bacterium]MCB1551098.1 DNA recombination protein RmuC [Alphaproteobacteria bacterium]MCB9985771.1 DNA recombination protein RmuC [Micavibrio sp.]HRK97597.1 DNA recombination protein RmuC [Alphaproteobacteria bacterium]